MTISGKYDLVSSDKYDEFLKAVGVGMIQRGVASKAHPTIEWLEKDGTWVQKTKTNFKSFEISFVPGEEFDEELADGRKCKSIITIEGDMLTHKQKAGTLESVITREFKGKEMTTKFMAGNVVATRVFRKL